MPSLPKTPADVAAVLALLGLAPVLIVFVNLIILGLASALEDTSAGCGPSRDNTPKSQQVFDKYW